jgi:hypothetical protein
VGPLFVKGVRGFRIGGYLKLDKDPDRGAKRRGRSMFTSVLLVLVLLSSDHHIVVA